MERLKDGYVEFYMKSKRLYIEDLRDKELQNELGKTKPPRETETPAERRIELMLTVENDLQLAQTVENLKTRVDNYNEWLEYSIAAFKDPQNGSKALATKKRLAFKQLENEWMSTLHDKFVLTKNRPRDLMYWVEETLGDKPRVDQKGHPGKFAEYASLKPWMEAAILDVMPDAWKMRQEIAELLINKKDGDWAKAMSLKEMYMNELAQAFDLMEEAEDEYIGDLEWKKDLLEALYLGGGKLAEGGATCTIRRRIAKILTGRPF